MAVVLVSPAFWVSHCTKPSTPKRQCTDKSWIFSAQVNKYSWLMHPPPIPIQESASSSEFPQVPSQTYWDDVWFFTDLLFWWYVLLSDVAGPRMYFFQLVKLAVYSVHVGETVLFHSSSNFQECSVDDLLGFDITIKQCDNKRHTNNCRRWVLDLRIRSDVFLVKESWMLWASRLPGF